MFLTFIRGPSFPAKYHDAIPTPMAWSPSCAFPELLWQARHGSMILHHPREWSVVIKIEPNWNLSAFPFMGRIDDAAQGCSCPWWPYFGKVGLFKAGNPRSWVGPQAGAAMGSRSGLVGRDQEVSEENGTQTLEDTAPSPLPVDPRHVPCCLLQLCVTAEWPQQWPFGTERGIGHSDIIFVRNSCHVECVCGAEPQPNLQQRLLTTNHGYFVSHEHSLRGVFCSRESQVSLQDFAMTDARTWSESHLKLLSIILFLELGSQGEGGSKPCPSVTLGFVWRDTSLQGPAPPAVVPTVT